jgi:phosphocarrier protein HPr
VKCQYVMILNKLGLHARASAKFVSLASEFASEVFLKRSDMKINGKSIMGIMMLAAAKGTELELCVDGPDEKQAIEALLTLINERFGEDE